MVAALTRYTVAEVAKHFGVSERYLSTTARKHKACGRAGRSLYFTESDIEALDRIWHGSVSTSAEKHGGSTGQSMASVSERARERLFGKTPKKSLPNASAKSTGNAFSERRPSSRSERHLAIT